MPDTATSETGTTTAGATGTSATWLDLELDDASALHRVGWQERPGLFLSVPATCQFALQARLAAVSQHMGLVNASSDACHRYLLNRHSIGRASASGVPFSELQSILITLLPHDSITSKQMAALHRWHEQGRSLRLTQLPLLRTQNKGQMAALWQEQPLRPLLGELLSPTVATLVAPLDEVSHLLRQAGYFVPPAAPEQTRCVEIDGNIDIAAERLLAPAEGAVLWLAGH